MPESGTTRTSSELGGSGSAGVPAIRVVSSAPAERVTRTATRSVARTGVGRRGSRAVASLQLDDVDLGRVRALAALAARAAGRQHHRIEVDDEQRGEQLLERARVAELGVLAQHPHDTVLADDA